MKQFFSLVSLTVLLLFIGYQGVAQSRGQVSNVQAQQRVDGSNIVDVYYDLSGFQDGYIISGELYQNNYLVGTILEDWCTGDFGPGYCSGQQQTF